ncbi:MAG: hypothetical protein ABJF04_05390 [Reichenbachiella sp.]|uniref:hypothetical protein n=1 Tax=Reichenbachiella sp. TaxID=2184521 RepID=UPI0032654BBC
MKIEVPFVSYNKRILADLIGGSLYMLLFAIPGILFSIRAIFNPNTETVLIAAITLSFSLGYLFITKNRMKWHLNFITSLTIDQEFLTIKYYVRNTEQEILKMPIESTKISFSGRGWGAANRFIHLTSANIKLEQAEKGNWAGKMFANILQEYRKARGEELTWDEKDWVKRLE